MTTLTLPAWDKANNQMIEGKDSPIETFIAEWEPLTNEAANLWRKQFCDALNYYKYKFTHTYDDPITETENDEEGRSNVDCECCTPEQRTTIPASTGEEERSTMGSSPFVPHGQDYRSSDQRDDDCTPGQCVCRDSENA